MAMVLDSAKQHCWPNARDAHCTNNNVHLCGNCSDSLAPGDKLMVKYNTGNYQQMYWERARLQEGDSVQAIGSSLCLAG